MKAIECKYYGPTNTRGSKIVASDSDGNKIAIPYPHELSGTDVYARAAIALCRKMGWKGTLVSGGLKKSEVFCFVDSDKYDIERDI